MKLSKNMEACLLRLYRGNRHITPRKGGYWLPGEVAQVFQDKTDSEWLYRSLKEFDCNVGTNTVYALHDRGMLSPFREPTGKQLNHCRMMLTIKALQYIHEKLLPGQKESR